MPSSSLPRRRTYGSGLVAAATALCLTTLSACGSGDDTDTSAGKGPVTITFWGWAKGTQEVVDAFNSSQQEVRVNFQEIPSGNAGGYAKISNAVKAGNAPDVFNVEYPQLPDFVSRGAVQDIGEHVSDGLKSKYLPQAMQMTTLGGTTWALPLDVAPQTFYYRKDVFEKAGITAPPKTWDEFRADAEKIKKAVPDTRIATFFPDDPSTFEAMAWQAGAQWFKAETESWKVGFQDAATNKTAAYWQKMIDDDLVQVAPSFSQQWTASLQKNQTVGYLGASWGAGVLGSTLPDQSGKWAAAPMPTFDGAPASGMLGGTTFAVSKDSEKAEAAVKFAEWATTTEDGIKARISTGTSSAYPAAPALVPIAQGTFKSTLFGDQDLYGMFQDGANSIRADWAWGPVMGTTNNSLKDSFAKVDDGSDIMTAVRGAETATKKELDNRGIKVTG
ncbi:ABC transporter substrate-binding protein [Streptomyces flaveolus]|uniref:ABC transporter substrate-binding protein n=1 Tax=Streptomyces flaveolus TaxID=67297 RepID=UPI0016711E3C|nr:sugar ABC transporter substrate-binding protein [Streptomyces flaveolus]GGQ86404.1 sugar ABC transporter substrate-binding protein [Streptomyces flaveolus]